MKTKLIAVAIAGSLVLAGCSGGGGGGGLSAEDEQELRDQVAAAEKAAEEARDAAEEAARREQAAREQAQQAAAEKARADAAEAAKERLEEEAEAAAARESRAEASKAHAGLSGTPVGANAPAVTPKYRAPATVRVAEATFPSGGVGAAAGNWYRTTFSSRTATHRDDIVVYSDKGRPTPTPIQQVHTDKTFTDDGNSFVRFPVGEAADANDIQSSSSLFPKVGGTAEIEMTVDSTDDNTDNPDRTALIAGTFDGASGHYQCEGTSASDCMVRHTGTGYVLTGTWTFRTSKAARVQVDDANFMHFGWWKRNTFAAGGSFSYRVFSEVTSGDNAAVTPPAALEGTASYRGAAIGQYAIYQPLGTQSNQGSFTASASLTANFDDAAAVGTLSGSITGFDVAPGWSVTLNERNISDVGTDGGNVSWTIDGTPAAEAGSWNAAFHSEIRPYAGHIPEGVTGTFNAEYGSVGRMTGAFGAHR